MKPIITLLIFLLSLNKSSIKAQIKLSADGKSDTYTLINKTLINTSRKAVEVPDCNHQEFGKHITQVFDNTLKKYVFQFDIHVDGDFDRCKRFDRQRNEIKTNKNSNPILLASENEIINYKWKFKIQKGFKATKKHTSFHQITYRTKGTNEPLFALSARNKNGKQTLEVHYIKDDEKEVLVKIDLSKITGKWIVADETIHYHKNGSYWLSLKTIDGKEILNLNRNNLNTWFNTKVYARPKWGIYRSLEYKEQLRDETLWFADIEVNDIKSN